MPTLLARLRRSQDTFAVACIALILTLLLLRWLGYQFNLFSTHFIGDERDTLFNSWTIYQAIDNLLHRPGNLGYSPMFYGDASTFAYTIAPYGIAVAMMPAYLLSGGNLILAYNVYYIATFVLTAVFMAWLVRYLFHAPLVVGMLIGLMVCFAQYRWLHVARVETLGTHWYILGLYCLHRLIDSPTWRRALALAVAFWFIALSSGYYGMMFIVMGTLVVLFVFVKFHAYLLRRVLPILVLAGGLSVLLLLPFVTFRAGNSVFWQGRPLGEVMYISTTPQTWLAGRTMLYEGSFAYYRATQSDEEALAFIGFTPLILAFLGWRFRNHTVTVKADENHLLSPRHAVILYGLFVVAGYIISLGPVIRLNGISIMPGPFILLLQLPGFGVARMPARFMLQAVIGTAMLGAFFLTVFYHQKPRATVAAALVLVSLTFAVELLPYTGHGQHRIGEGGQGAAEYLSPRSYPPEPVYDWLLEQPEDTVIFEYPAGYPNIAQDFYFYFLPYHNRPTINGIGSFTPRWYEETDWMAFPDIRTLSIAWDRQVRYVFVHHELMTPQDETQLAQNFVEYEALGNSLPYVGRFGDVDVYEMAPANALRMEFDENFLGEGWHSPEVGADFSFRWMADTTATIQLPLERDEPLELSLHAYGAMRSFLFDHFSLEVNGTPIPLQRGEGDAANTFSGLIPQAALESESRLTTLSLHIDQTLSPLDQGDSSDSRQLGIALDWLLLHPEGDEMND